MVCHVCPRTIMYLQQVWIIDLWFSGQDNNNQINLMWKPITVTTGICLSSVTLVLRSCDHAFSCIPSPRATQTFPRDWLAGFHAQPNKSEWFTNTVLLPSHWHTAAAKCRRGLLSVSLCSCCRCIFIAWIVRPLQIPLNESLLMPASSAAVGLNTTVTTEAEAVTASAPGCSCPNSCRRSAWHLCPDYCCPQYSDCRACGWCCQESWR